ncbi:alpha/beta hydrolase [Aurantimonas sp. Leaf443]|uniref:alpha/beta fold hydrolase n=1 Tax=Aurantimonas sp. Leaf443 TaxID=1736378 RepID=UPI0006FF4603|nr:alpha/beta hydrolase [Aurantimonas sp. Leaf443]KQT84072.1 alpha/beta hydrolase [Aurantimonas sp. Leaf443]
MTGLHVSKADGARLVLDDAGGDGAPVFFQHGLCGDAGQTREAFPADPAFRRLTLEMPGHGGSQAGDPAHYSIARFTQDLADAIEALGAGSVAVGGISMGAAIALRLAVTRPDLVRGLVLARPAWVTAAAPDNMAPNAEVGALLATRSPEAARAAFLEGDTARRLAEEAPDNLASLKGFFSREPIAVTAALLRSISADGPGVTDAQIAALSLPVLVIGHARDAVHPLAHAQALAAAIPGARLARITPKAVDKAAYVSDIHEALGAFLKDLPR